MCLLNFRFHDHPEYKLILTANRDEAYDRPTAAAHFWEDAPTVLAGRDLLKMGTWLGITKTGRFAALTNFYNSKADAKEKSIYAHSRGNIVRDYLTSDTSPEAFISALQEKRLQFDGFNLLIGDAEELFHYNNVLNQFTPVLPGTHGLSNDTLDIPWPKVTRGNEQLIQATQNNALPKTEALFFFFNHTAERKGQCSARPTRKRSSFSSTFSIRYRFFYHLND
nr:NRDE family protein [Carnobacterium mobile]